MVFTDIPSDVNEQGIDHNDPAMFDIQHPDRQAALLKWIEMNLTPGGRSQTRSTYGLKHDAEEWLGTYVGNGEMKGAMRAAGYTYLKETRESDINWRYCVYVVTSRKENKEMVTLRELRVKKGLSQTELASKAGVSYNTVSHMERGIRVSVKKAMSVCDALGVTLDDIAGLNITTSRV